MQRNDPPRCTRLSGELGLRESMDLLGSIGLSITAVAGMPPAERTCRA